MKATRIALRPLRKVAPVLPANIGNERVLLARVNAAGEVLEWMVFDNHVGLYRTCVHGWTHWARLPASLPWRAKK